MPREGTGTVITSMLHALQELLWGWEVNFRTFIPVGCVQHVSCPIVISNGSFTIAMQLIVSFCTSLWWRRAQENLNSPQMLEYQDAPIFDHLWVTWQSAEVATKLPENSICNLESHPLFDLFCMNILEKGRVIRTKFPLRVLAVYFLGGVV